VPEAAEPLVGIVVVSHSAKIAEGVVELARQMAGPDVAAVVAAAEEAANMPKDVA